MNHLTRAQHEHRAQSKHQQHKERCPDGQWQTVSVMVEWCIKCGAINVYGEVEVHYPIDAEPRGAQEGRITQIKPVELTGCAKCGQPLPWHRVLTSKVVECPEGQLFS